MDEKHRDTPEIAIKFALYLIDLIGSLYVALFIEHI